MSIRITRNDTFDDIDGDWIDVIDVGRYDVIIEKLTNNIYSSSKEILEDVRSIIDEYNGRADIDVCLICLGNYNRWHKYVFIFNELCDDHTTSYENSLLMNITFNDSDKCWYYQR